MNNETITDIKKLLENSVCLAINNEGGFLQISFATCHLSIGCAWRISQKDTMIGSGTKAENANSSMLQLKNSTVTNIFVNGEFNNLDVQFSNDIRLETFADSSEYEHWVLATGGAEMIVSGPGKLWSGF